MERHQVIARACSLDQSHMRGISATLSLLDKTMCEFEEWANGREIHSILFEIENPLAPEVGRHILQLLMEMWETIRDIRDTLGLEKTIRTADRIILGSCSTNWAALLELQGTRLRRYGEIQDELVSYLDPKTKLLTDALRQIASIAAGRTSEG